MHQPTHQRTKHDVGGRAGQPLGDAFFGDSLYREDRTELLALTAGTNAFSLAEGFEDSIARTAIDGETAANAPEFRQLYRR